MPGIPRVQFTVNTETGGGVRQGAGALALLAPLDATASVSANEVTEYTTPQAVADDHGTGSDLHEGAKAALSMLRSVLVVGVDDFTDDNGNQGPFVETITTADLTGGTEGVLGDIDSDGSSERIPITEVTTFKVDGTEVSGSILYTHLDPSGETVSAGDVLINPTTGDFKTGDTVSTDVEVSYSVHDWDAAFELLDLEVYETHVPANRVFNAQNSGIYDTFITHAGNKDKNIITALASGVAPSDVSALVTAKQDSNLMIHAAHYSTGDAVSAYAARVLQEPVDGTMTEQTAPRGLTFTDTYTNEDIGDPESPATGTFLNFGVAPTFKDEGGTYRIAADRAATGLTDFFRNFSVSRSLRLTKVSYDATLIELRRSSSTAIPFNGVGQSKLRAQLKKESDRLFDGTDDGAPLAQRVDLNEILVPSASTQTDSDLTARVWRGIEIPVKIANQAEVFTLILNARL